MILLRQAGTGTNTLNCPSLGWREIWPLPNVSSTAPGSQCRVSPSLVSNSTHPVNHMTNWRTAVVCQSAISVRQAPTQTAQRSPFPKPTDGLELPRETVPSGRAGYLYPRNATLHLHQHRYEGISLVLPWVCASLSSGAFTMSASIASGLSMLRLMTTQY
jgi:hypothetical protein